MTDTLDGLSATELGHMLYMRAKDAELEVARLQAENGRLRNALEKILGAVEPNRNLTAPTAIAAWDAQGIACVKATARTALESP